MRFATIPLGHDQVEQLEKESREGLYAIKGGNTTVNTATPASDIVAGSKEGLSEYGIPVAV